MKNKYGNLKIMIDKQPLPDYNSLSRYEITNYKEEIKMMRQEFEKLTGIEVNMEEYSMIEQMYYNFDGDKQAFCKQFVKDNWMVAVLRKLLEIEKADHDCTEYELAEAQKKLDEAAKTINHLCEKLEREQEWKPWTPERAVKQEQYDHLHNSGHEMTDEEARQWIADEWGYDLAKIRINRKMKKYEVNRHHQLRQVGEIERAPYYDATDWYYVFFTVCGMDYEAYNGSLIQL